MSQKTVADISTVFAEKSVDLFLTCASFEERCFEIPMNLEGGNVKSIVFFNENEDKKIVANARRMVKILGDSTQPVRLNSDDPIGNWVSITSVLENAFQEINQNVFVDVTTFTHETLLVLIRILGDMSGSYGKLTVGYVGAKEYSFNILDDNEKWLSKGIKQIRTVLGYPGFTDPTYKNHLIILFGFELERTRKLIMSYEFHKISLGFAEVSGAIQNNHFLINEDRHKILLSEFPHASEFNFSLVDIGSAQKTLISITDENREYNTVIAPMNNKMSTIAAGLTAMCREDIQISYAQPNLYNSTSYSISNGKVYIEDINF